MLTRKQVLLASLMLSGAMASSVQAASVNSIKIPVPGINSRTANPADEPQPTTLGVAYFSSNNFGKNATYSKGATEVGNFAAARFVVKNTGSATAEFDTKFTASGTDSAGVYLANNLPDINCLGKTSLPPAGTCTLYVAYPIAHVGQSEVNIKLLDLTLTMVAQVSEPTLAEVSPSYWGTTPADPSTRPQENTGITSYVMFANVRGNAFYPTSVSVTGDWELDTTAYNWVTACQLSLAVIYGQPCKVSVKLKNPVATGVHTGAVTLTYRNSGNTLNATKVVPLIATLSN